MRRFSNPAPNLCFLLAATLICLAGAVSAQPPETKTKTDDDLKQGSHRSLMLTRRQSVIQCMDLIREAFSRKDYLGALPLMERILSEPNSFVPLDATTEIAAHEEVQRLVLQIPADLRKRLDDQRASVAARQWEDVRTSTTEHLIAFLRQYFDLPIAVEAWWSLGQMERDHGRFQMASSSFLKIADHPQANRQQQLIALIATYETLIDDKRPTDADLILKRIARFDANLEIVLGNRSLRLSQWLSERPQIEHQPATTEPLSNIVQSRSRRPVVLPTWKNSFNAIAAANQLIREQRQRNLGVKPVPILRPLIVGDNVIARNLDAVYAINLATGVPQKLCDNAEYRDLEGLGIFDRFANQNAVIDWVQRRTEADSIFARMTTDGQRVFVIQEPDRVREFGIDRPSIRGGFRSGPHYNKLCAYSVVNPESNWEIGGNLRDAISPYSGDFFLGCPLSLDDQLFVLVQRETEVILRAIDPQQGALLWSLTLGDVLLPVTEDLQRSRVACPIIWSDGLLLISTGAGAVVAVDPALRSLRWGYRYSARTISAGDLVQGQVPGDAHQVQESWWDSWREPFLMALQPAPAKANPAGAGKSQTPSAALMVFASPETDQLHAIRLPDGEPLWREPRNGGLLIAGIFENLIIVMEGDFVRAQDIQTGRQVWRTPTADVSGPGAFSGGILVLPLLSGGTMLIDARSGQTLADSGNSDISLGSLTETDRGWIAFSRQSIMLLPRLSDVRSEVIRELQASPDDEALRVRAAFLDLQAGDFGAARAHLEGLRSTPARDLRRQALLEALLDFDNLPSSADRSELARQLKDLAEGPDYRFAAAMAIGRSALSVKDYPAAVDAALDGLSANLDQTEGLVKSDAAVVRKDRVLSGLIDEAYRRIAPHERPALDELFQRRLKEARKSRNKSAVSLLATQWRGLDWGRTLVVMDEDKALRNSSVAEVELRLLDAAGSNDREIALRALEKLATRFERNGAWRDAWAISRRIQTEFPASNPAVQPANANPANPLPVPANASLKRPKPMWPGESPHWDSTDDVRFSFYTLIPIHAEPGSLADRLDVWIERNGNELLFRGDKFFQSGQEENSERKFTLPSSTSAYRGQVGYMLREGWGIGRVVILLVGSELFGVAPLDDQGQPNAQPLWWANSIELGPPPTNAVVLKGHANVNNGFEYLVDQSNRQIGKVGPVRAGYFCYQKGSKLVAAEVENGNQLWERLELPADATVLGDDHCVYLWREGNRLEVLSAIDGRKLEERVWNHSPANLFHHRGSLAWTIMRGAELRLELYDLKSGQLIWSRADDKNSSAAILDPETIALTTPDGQLHLLEARTGRLLCPPVTVNQKNSPRMLTWYDPDRWFIAMSGSAENLQPFKSNHSHEAYRRMQVRGTLYCFDRYEPRLLWQRELKDEPISLDQSRVSPVLVQLWKKLLASNSNAVEFVLRVTDKRTGKLLPIKPKADLENYFLLNPDLEQAIVEIRLKYETIRLHYTPESPVDALDAVQGKGERPRSD